MRGPSVCLVLALAAAARGDPVWFRNEVMAVLSRAGCNQGPATAT